MVSLVPTISLPKISLRSQSSSCRWEQLDRRHCCDRQSHYELAHDFFDVKIAMTIAADSPAVSRCSRQWSSTVFYVYIAVCCNVLQHVVMCCSMSKAVIYCILCCSAL